MRGFTAEPARTGFRGFARGAWVWSEIWLGGDKATGWRKGWPAGGGYRSGGAADTSSVSDSCRHGVGRAAAGDPNME